MNETEDQSDPFRKWRGDPNKHNHEDTGMYSISYPSRPLFYIVSMMSRIYGYPNTQICSFQCVALIEVASDGYIMDW